MVECPHATEWVLINLFLLDNDIVSSHTAKELNAIAYTFFCYQIVPRVLCHVRFSLVYGVFILRKLVLLCLLFVAMRLTLGTLG